MSLQKHPGAVAVWLRAVTLFIASLSVLSPSTASAQVSNCFDHYKPDSWDGEGLAILLCRNSPDMTSCAMHRRGGERLQGLVQHGSRDLGRQVFTDYHTLGTTYPFPVDIICTNGSVTQTYQILSGDRWDEGCCRNRDVGSTACCGTGGSTPGCEAPAFETPTPDTRSGDACPPLRSRTFGSGAQLLDAPACDGAELTFRIDSVPNPARISYAELRMRLRDSDHPSIEGVIWVNGNGPLELPADAAWGDIDVDAVLALPASYLVEGTNEVRFGVGNLSRNYYLVSNVSLDVHGAACETAPPPDAGVDSGVAVETDAGSAADTDAGRTADADAGGAEDAGGTGTVEPVCRADVDCRGRGELSCVRGTCQERVLSGGCDCSISRSNNSNDWQFLGWITLLGAVVSRMRRRT